MADNIAISAGSGTTVATEDVSGVHHQKVKIEFGADGVATMVEEAAPLPVEDTAAASELADANALLTTIDASLAASVTELPHGALDATNDLTKVIGTRSTSGETSLVSATASQTTRVHRGHISAAGAVTVSLLDGSGGSVLETWEFPAAGAWDIPFDSRPYAVTTANTALYVSTDAAVAVHWTFEYKKGA